MDIQITRAELFRLFITEGKTKAEIAHYFGCKVWRVELRLKETGVGKMRGGDGLINFKKISEMFGIPIEDLKLLGEPNGAASMPATAPSPSSSSRPHAAVARAADEESAGGDAGDEDNEGDEFDSAGEFCEISKLTASEPVKSEPVKSEPVPTRIRVKGADPIVMSRETVLWLHSIHEGRVQAEDDRKLNRQPRRRSMAEVGGLVGVERKALGKIFTAHNLPISKSGNRAGVSPEVAAAAIAMSAAEAAHPHQQPQQPQQPPPAPTDHSPEDRRRAAQMIIRFPNLDRVKLRELCAEKGLTAEQITRTYGARRDDVEFLIDYYHIEPATNSLSESGDRSVEVVEEAAAEAAAEAAGGVTVFEPDEESSMPGKSVTENTEPLAAGAAAADPAPPSPPLPTSPVLLLTSREEIRAAAAEILLRLPTAAGIAPHLIEPVEDFPGGGGGGDDFALEKFEESRRGAWSYPSLEPGGQKSSRKPGSSSTSSRGGEKESGDEAAAAAAEIERRPFSVSDIETARKDPHPLIENYKLIIYVYNDMKYTWQDPDAGTIAERLGLDAKKVEMILNAAGLVALSSARAAFRAAWCQRFPLFPPERVAALYLSGAGLKPLAVCLGVYLPTVKKCLAIFGVPVQEDERINFRRRAEKEEDDFVDDGNERQVSKQQNDFDPEMSEPLRRLFAGQRSAPEPEEYESTDSPEIGGEGEGEGDEESEPRELSIEQQHLPLMAPPAKLPKMLRDIPPKSDLEEMIGSWKMDVLAIASYYKCSARWVKIWLENYKITPPAAGEEERRIFPEPPPPRFRQNAGERPIRNPSRVVSLKIEPGRAEEITVPISRINSTESRQTVFVVKGRDIEAAKNEIEKTRQQQREEPFGSEAKTAESSGTGTDSGKSRSPHLLRIKPKPVDRSGFSSKLMTAEESRKMARRDRLHPHWAPVPLLPAKKFDPQTKDFKNNKKRR